MLEVIVLITLSRSIGSLADDKGQNPGRWKLYVVLAWILTEFTVGIIGGILGANIFVILLFAYPLAYISYVILKKRLQKMPDKDEWLSELGSGDANA